MFSEFGFHPSDLPVSMSHIELMHREWTPKNGLSFVQLPSVNIQIHHLYFIFPTFVCVCVLQIFPPYSTYSKRCSKTHQCSSFHAFIFNKIPLLHLSFTVLHFALLMLASDSLNYLFTHLHGDLIYLDSASSSPYWPDWTSHIWRLDSLFFPPLF